MIYITGVAARAPAKANGSEKSHQLMGPISPRPRNNRGKNRYLNGPCFPCARPRSTHKQLGPIAPTPGINRGKVPLP